MLESRYIPRKHVTRVQAASQGQCKTEDVSVNKGGMKPWSCCSHQEQCHSVSPRCCISIRVLWSCTVCRGTFSLKEAPAYKPPVGAGAVTDHQGFISDIQAKGMLLLEHVGSTGCIKHLPAYIRNVKCWCLISICIWDPWFYTFGTVKVQAGTWDPW